MSDNDPAAEAAHPDAPAAMQPGPHHAVLGVFAGTWRAEVSLWMLPEAEPQVSEGTMVNQWVLGGRFLAQRYEGEPDGLFQGRGYWGFNNGAHRYEGFWIDSASTVMQTEAGSYDPATRTFTMEGQLAHPVTGEPLKRHSVITVISDDEHHMEIFMPGPDGHLRKSVAIVYRRIEDAA